LAPRASGRRHNIPARARTGDDADPWQRAAVARVTLRRRNAAAGVASAAVLAAALGAPAVGSAQDPTATTATTTTAPEPTVPQPAPDPPPAEATPAPAPPAQAPAPAAAPAAVPAPAPTDPALAHPLVLSMPYLPQTSLPPVVPPVAIEDAPAPKRHEEDVLGTNRGLPLPAGGGAAIDPGVLAAKGTVGIPPFFIDTFGVPPFLLPIYQAAGIQYGVPWEVLAAINEVESDYGRNLAVSSAGAVGWMQFLPATFAQYGVDANNDGTTDPYNPVDAIFSAARYLQAAGAGSDLVAALFAYNHSDAYVSGVLQRARLLGGLPADLVAALSGLTQGRPPVLGPAEPARHDARAKRAKTLRLRTGRHAAVVAVTDGLVVGTGSNRRLGRYIRLRDVFGNTYTYGAIRATAPRYPVLARAIQAGAQPAPAAAPSAPAPQPLVARPTDLWPALASTNWRAQGAPAAAAPATRAAAPSISAYDRRLLGGVAARDVRYKPLRKGSRVIAGTILAHAGDAGRDSGRLFFEIRPAGRGAPRIQPAPVVESWNLRALAVHTGPRADGETHAAIGRMLLLGAPELRRQVLADDRIAIAGCGREDVRAGRVDRRVLATLKFLAMSGLDPTVSALRCGHERLGAPGEAAAHAGGAAVDISAINGVLVAGAQGPSELAVTAIRRLAELQGSLRPRSIISAVALPGVANTLAAADHADTIHVGFAAPGTQTTLQQRSSDGIVPASTWKRLGRRLGAIVNPRVRPGP
jgi:hypothetical protein